MEHIQGRPQIADIYCPLRQELNDGNAYLSNMGLIVLIRGSPSTQLPRLIAEKMVQTHGGTLQDYMVAQATISPYVITCPNTRIRDRLVQRGMYSIPQLQVQFTVHEWRPRFGMGYDPPTQQVWVKLIGLPLQAWTVPEISAVLRNFGHPVEILPFGRNAGHFKDITALVDTNNMNTIPLAYAYREDDYATQVQVVILSSRPWQSTYFPPPDLPQIQPHPPNQQQNNQSQITPNHHSSSSSSNGLPSEPTIDYSSWSPRSYSASVSSVLKWMPKLNQSQPPLPCPNSNSIGLSLLLQRPHSLKNRVHLRVHLRHGLPHSCTGPLATKEPNSPRFPRQIYSVLPSFNAPAPVPSPIGATAPLSFLIDCTGCHSLGGALSKPILGLQSGLSILQYDYQVEDNTQKGIIPAHVNRSSTQILMQAFCYWVSQTSTYEAREDLTCEARQACEDIDLSRNSNKALNLLSTHPDGLKLLSNSSQLTPFQSPQENERSSLVRSKTRNPLLCKELLPMAVNALDPMDTQVRNESSSLFPLRQQKKKKQTPTRRSKRIQARQKKRNAPIDSFPKPKSKVAKIPFDLDTSLDPLDAGLAVNLLQATGLHINDQVRQMIDDAVKHDKETESIGQLAPSTPLHDLTPPLAIPGTDILL